jgi:hypothetical protein
MLFLLCVSSPCPHPLRRRGFWLDEARKAHGWRCLCGRHGQAACAQRVARARCEEMRLVEMNPVLVELLDTPCSPRPAYVRLLPAPPATPLWSWSIPFGRSASLHSFLSPPAHRSARALAPSPCPACCPSYTRSLTCHNLLFRHFPFFREPTHTCTLSWSPPPSRRDPLFTHSASLPSLQNAFLPIGPWSRVRLYCDSRPLLHGERACHVRPTRPSVPAYQHLLSTLG